MSFNKVLILGRLGRDPELQNTTSGVAICKFNMATNKKWKTQGGEVKEKIEWHKIVAYRKTAELCSKYLQKGSQVFIEGELTTSKWQDKNGNDRYTTEIIANNVQFTERANTQQNNSQGEQRQQTNSCDPNVMPD